MLSHALARVYARGMRSPRAGRPRASGIGVTTRRDVLRGLTGGLALAAGGAAARTTGVGALAARQDVPVVHTVTGPMPIDAMGLTLSHEHMFSLFGEAPTSSPRYPARLVDTVAPYLGYLHALGVRTIVDATAAWFGRAPELLRELSERSGVRILTNTGLYGAADDRYVPEDLRRASPTALADRWTREFEDGIGDTGIRPGFMKIGVDTGPLSALDHRLVVAAARTHLRTGLTIAVHTGDNPAAAARQQALLGEEGVALDAWVWVHAHTCRDDAALWQAAERGAWLGFDGLAAASYDRHLTLVLEARRRGLLARVLLSHDGNAFPAGGRPPRSFDLLLTTFRYRLEEEGLSRDELAGLLVRNPAAAWGVRVRRA